MNQAGRWGIFGGSFDPPHNGHVYMARQAQASLRLERLLIVPTAGNPLKNPAAAGLEQRQALVQLLLAELPGAELDLSQLKQPGPTYTIDYLRAFKLRHPRLRPILLMGMDAWQSFADWREPLAIVALADIAVFRRDQLCDSKTILQPIQNIESIESLNSVCYHQDSDAAMEYWSWQGGADRKQTVTLWLLPGQPPNVSSTEIRRCLAVNQAIDAMVPASIAAYIQQQQLYR